MRLSPLLLLCLAALAGCGQSVPDRPVNRDIPGVVVGGRQYENGGADGSGADGKEVDAPRGGIAAGPDNREPGESKLGDESTKPPASDQP